VKTDPEVAGSRLRHFNVHTCERCAPGAPLSPAVALHELQDFVQVAFEAELFGLSSGSGGSVEEEVGDLGPDGAGDPSRGARASGLSAPFTPP
jgi:hypothetical protein